MAHVSTLVFYFRFSVQNLVGREKRNYYSFAKVINGVAVIALQSGTFDILI